jgi:hypothetical protein
MSSLRPNICISSLYCSEVSERLQEVNDVKAALAEAQASILKKEAEIIKIHKMVSGCCRGQCLYAHAEHGLW